MIRGSCLCGKVRYEIDGPLFEALNCHCSMCRKAHGAAFRSRARVRANHFRWVHGEDQITYYESSSGNRRGFCRTCGSPILSKFESDPAVFSLPLGPLDDDPGVRPEQHVYVKSKAPWFVISDGLRQFDELPEP
jgi:hypothetical protein